MKRPAAASIPFIPAAVGVAVFAATVVNGYIYDDVAIVAQQPMLHSLRHVPTLLASPWWMMQQRLYRPLSLVSLCLDWVITNGSPWLSHVENVLLHAIVVFLVTRLALRWLSTEGALAAGLVFALAPAHVEVVSTLVGRAELLSALFLLLAMLLCTSERPPSPPRRLLLAALAALALASKEVGVIAPAVVLAAAWTTPTQRRHAWQWAVAALAGVVPMLLARVIVLHTLTGDLAHPAFRITGTAGREAIALAVLPRTALHLFIPLVPPVDVAPTLAQVRSPNALLIVLGAALLVAGGAILVRHFARPSPVTLGMWIMAAGISPTANLLFASGVVLAGRDLYAPSIGGALCIGAIVTEVRSRVAGSRLRSMVTVAVGAWLAAAAVVTITQLGMWRDRDRLVAALIRQEPDSYRAHYFAASIDLAKGQRDDALIEYRQGVALFPADPMFLTDAARAAIVAGDTVTAMRWLRSAIAASPTQSYLARTRLMLLLMARGDSAAALTLADDGLAVLPDQRVWRDIRARLERGGG